MKGFRAILGKELDRVLKDKKMIFSMFILPIVLVVGIVALIVGLVKGISDDVEENIPLVYIIDAPDAFKDMLKVTEDFEIEYYDSNNINSSDMDEYKQMLKDGDLDLIVEYPKDFIEQISNTETVMLPQVKTYYNPSEDYSSAARSNFLGYIEQYRMTLVAEKFGSIEYALIFTVDSDNPDLEVQDDGKAFGKLLGMMVPYFITMMIFASAMGLGVDSIAGEKERGTIASLLLSPVNRVEIVLAKVVSLGVLSVLSALIYILSIVGVGVIGINVFGGKEVMENMPISFSAVQVFELIVLVIGLVILYVSIISLVAVLAKDTKQASSYISPVYMVVLVVGMINMYTMGDPQTVEYIIPIYGASTAFKGILMGVTTFPQFMLTVLGTYGMGAVIIWLTTRAFKSEKIMFNA